MSDHLPECPATEVSMSGHSTPPPDYELTYTACICSALRACEQRVRAEIKVFAETEWCKGHVVGEQQGFTLGTQAARDAVDVALLGTLQTTRDRAIAAIDALRSHHDT